MKIAPAALSTIALALAIAPGLALAQHDHGTHAAHAGPADHAAPAAIPSDHVRWTPDAPLVDGMGQVRKAVATLAHLEMGHLGEAHVLTLAGDVDAAVESMFANCRLEPEPDVALHGILARLMAGSKALRDAPADPAPVGPMRDALADYERLFDDPAGDDRR
ncbi:DnrO protein [Luteimonas sp. Sa2BVA3]|uniref:DnrO protein n=1 Tax=Luteimonas colneyensis TaxID=2762230 RepID=A0ABR8UM09_9GAMM|nr:DnrO protein [Luteimonas colneyensis]MBD7989058.1 DnrO protein [Luteimonas colneyensis]